MITAKFDLALNKRIKKFPCIGISTTGDTVVVLFTGNCEGVVLSSEDIDFPVGEYFDSFDMSVFIPLETSITLKNV